MTTRKHTRTFYVHRHNAYYGQAVMIEQIVRNFQHSPSLTPEAKALTHEALGLIIRLRAEIYHRRQEPDGSISIVKHKEPSYD